MVLLSFIFGLLGFAPLPVIGGLGWIAALILSKAGRKKIDKNPEKYKGRGFAVAGQVLGLIGITLALLALAVVIGGMVGAVYVLISNAARNRKQRLTT